MTFSQIDQTSNLGSLAGVSINLVFMGHFMSTQPLPDLAASNSNQQGLRKSTEGSVLALHATDLGSVPSTT